MKEVRAYVRQAVESRVIEALVADGCTDFSIVEARGIVRGLRPDEVEYSVQMGTAYERLARIEVVCADAVAEHIADVIRLAASTGRAGDGAIFLSTMDDAIRIRDGSRGETVVRR